MLINSWLIHFAVESVKHKVTVFINEAGDGFDQPEPSILVELGSRQKLVRIAKSDLVNIPSEESLYSERHTESQDWTSKLRPVSLTRLARTVVGRIREVKLAKEE